MLCIAALIAILGCSLASAQDSNESVPAAPEPSQQGIASLCKGCMINNECVRVGVQVQSSIESDAYYCGSDYRAGKVKGEGEECTNNYECASYSCEVSLCASLQEKVAEDEPLLSKSFLYIAGASVMFIILLLVII